MQDNESASTTANAELISEQYGISYAVSEDLSVSYGVGNT